MIKGYKRLKGFSFSVQPWPGGSLAAWGTFWGSFFPLGAAAAVTVLLIIGNSPDPSQSLRAFFIGPWVGPWFLGNTLDHIGLLLTSSLGIALAFRGGCFNLGGEGQIYLGGLAAALVLLPQGTVNGAAAVGLLCLAALAAVGTGGIMGAVSGILKRKFQTNELITSFLLSACLTPLGNYLISGPFRDPGGNLLATPRLPPGLLLLRILPPSNLSLSFIFALALVVGGHLFINKTAPGYRFRIAGAAADFARYGGIRVESAWIPALTVSGALSGLTGFFAVAGTYGLCHLDFPGGLGWNAIAVALIARNKPLALFPAALVYGWLKAGSDSAMLASAFNFETAAFIQATIVLLATVRFERPSLPWRRILKKRSRGKV